MRKVIEVWVVLCLLLLSAAWFADTGRAEAGKKLLVRLHTTTEQQMERLPGWLDIAGARPLEWTDVIVREEELSRLRELGIPMEVLVEDIEAYMGAQAGVYHTYPQIASILVGFVNDYPDIAKLDTIGQGYQGNKIFLLKISDNVDVEEGDVEEEILINAGDHAREWPGVEVALFMADSLLSGYGVVPGITDIINNQQIWIIPSINPDGYVYSHDQGHDWRKNRHYFSQYASWGVDLNRNRSGSNNGDRLGQWGSVQGSISNNPDQEVYCGPGPASENETQALVNFAEQHDFMFMVNMHTYGELVLWPWGYSYSGSPDASLMSSIGTQMANRIGGQYGGHYTPQQSVQLYPTTGDGTDYLYGWNLYVGGTNTFAYTIEAAQSFQPPANQLDQIVRENWDGIYYLMTVADSVRALLTPRVMAPELDPMTTDSDGNYTVSWTEANPAAGATQYELDELTGYTVAEDNAEAGSGLWVLNGFTLSTARYHSSSHSYYSTTMGNNQSVTMKTKYPYFVEPGDSLTYWCWYSIENEWDYAFVEVSLEGKEWDLLASYTGSQSTWQRKALSLGNYVGKWIFIQIRYITDDNTVETGFNVDDIALVPNFSTEMVLSTTIPDTFYDVFGRPNGLYYYRVKGYNTPRSWGDFGQYEAMEVRRGKMHKEPYKF